jgi:hypothetical protein
MAIKLYYSLFSDQNASADQIVVIEEPPGKYSSPQPQVTGAKRKEPEGKGMMINPSSKRVYRKIVFHLIRPPRGRLLFYLFSLGFPALAWRLASVTRGVFEVVAR